MVTLTVSVIKKSCYWPCGFNEVKNKPIFTCIYRNVVPRHAGPIEYLGDGFAGVRPVRGDGLFERPIARRARNFPSHVRTVVMGRCEVLAWMLLIQVDISCFRHYISNRILVSLYTLLDTSSDYFYIGKVYFEHTHFLHFFIFATKIYCYFL